MRDSGIWNKSICFLDRRRVRPAKATRKVVQALNGEIDIIPNQLSVVQLSEYLSVDNADAEDWRERRRKCTEREIAAREVRGYHYNTSRDLALVLMLKKSVAWC